MHRSLKLAVLIVPILAVTLTPTQGQNLPLQEYYVLSKLKAAAPPHAMRLVRNDTEYGTSSVQSGLVFSYKSRTAKKVSIAGDFSNWKPVKMTRNSQGVWYYFLAEYSASDIVRYKYIVDSVWTADPLNTSSLDDGYGSLVSISRGAQSPEGRRVTYRMIDKTTVEFRIYAPQAHYIAVVGDFNSWNPENDLLTKDDTHIWRVVKKLKKGTYRYKFVIDGTWQPDIYNQMSASDNAGEVCSVLKI